MAVWDGSSQSIKGGQSDGFPDCLIETHIDAR